MKEVLFILAHILIVLCNDLPLHFGSGLLLQSGKYKNFKFAKTKLGLSINFQKIKLEDLSSVAVKNSAILVGDSNSDFKKLQRELDKFETEIGRIKAQIEPFNKLQNQVTNQDYKIGDLVKTVTVNEEKIKKLENLPASTTDFLSIVTELQTEVTDKFMTYFGGLGILFLLVSVVLLLVYKKLVRRMENLTQDIELNNRGGYVYA